MALISNRSLRGILSRFVLLSTALFGVLILATSREDAMTSSARIVFISEMASNSDLFHIDLMGSHLRQLTRLNSMQTRWVYGADCSPGGQYVLFSSGTQIFRINADGSDLTSLPTYNMYSYVSFSPDGEHITFDAVFSEYSSNFEIYLARPDFTGIVRLTHTPEADNQPAWSPDGQKIVYRFRDSEYSGLTVIDRDGSQPREVIRTTALVAAPVWSPNNQTIAYSSDQDGTANIYLMRPDGSEVVQLTRDSGNNIYPKWSPDGSLITFSSDRGGENYQVYIMEADGRNVRRVTPNFLANYDNYNRCWLIPPTGYTPSYRLPD
jgi:TolB protein